MGYFYLPGSIGPYQHFKMTHTLQPGPLSWRGFLFLLHETWKTHNATLQCDVNKAASIITKSHDSNTDL